MKKLTVTEVAAEKGCSDGTVLLAIRRQELEAVRVGKRIYVDPISAAGWRTPTSTVNRKPAA